MQTRRSRRGCAGRSSDLLHLESVAARARPQSFALLATAGVVLQSPLRRGLTYQLHKPVPGAGSHRLARAAGHLVRAGGQRGVHAARRAERGAGGAAARAQAALWRAGAQAGLFPGVGAGVAGGAVPGGGQARAAAVRGARVHRQDMDHVRTAKCLLKRVCVCGLLAPANLTRLWALLAGAATSECKRLPCKSPPGWPALGEKLAYAGS